MKLRWLIVALLCFVAPASAYWQSRNSNYNQSAAVAGYQGPGDIVSGATAFYSCGRAYNAAYANGTNPLCDLVDASTFTALCTLRVATTGYADLTGAYCVGSTTPATICAAASLGKCAVKKIYDQTGNSHDVIGASDSSTIPYLVLNALNSNPCLNSDSLNRYAETSGNVTQNQPYTFMGVAERTGSNTTAQRIIGAANVETLGFRASTNTVGINAGTVLTNTASDSSFHALIGVINSTSSAMVVDGSIASESGTDAGTNNISTHLDIMNDNSRTVGIISGFVCEAGLWPSAFSATDYGNMNTNMHSATSGWNF